LRRLAFRNARAALAERRKTEALEELTTIVIHMTHLEFFDMELEEKGKPVSSSDLLGIFGNKLMGYPPYVLEVVQNLNLLSKNLNPWWTHNAPFILQLVQVLFDEIKVVPPKRKKKKKKKKKKANTTAVANASSLGEDLDEDDNFFDDKNQSLGEAFLDLYRQNQVRPHLDVQGDAAGLLFENAELKSDK